MAKPDQIPSDLTLELTGNLSPDRFMTAARAFFSCVQEIGRVVVPEGNPPEWIVRTREGSHLLGLDPAPGVQLSVVKAVYARVRLGLSQLENGTLVEEGAISFLLPDGAIKHLKTLADIAQRQKRNPVAVRFWVEKKPTEIGREMAKALDESLGEDYRDYGTVEGKLDAIQDRSRLTIRVFDPV